MKIIFSFALAFVLSLLCFPQISLSFQDLTAPSNAFTYNDTSFSKIDEIYWDDGTFDKAKFDKLLQQTSGISTLTSADLSALSTKINSANITANDMQGFTTGGKTAGQDIVVRMGGLDWTPTYLSKTKSGDLILTMWLSNNEQDAFQNRTDNAAEGDYYGYVKSSITNKYGLYSDWSADGYDGGFSRSYPYPEDMYGTSYIRSVTLNNGGQYAISNTELAADPGQNSNSVFAPFTMGDLATFIVTPLEVVWQEYGQNTMSQLGASYSSSNENWAKDIPDTGTVSTDPFNENYKFLSKAFNYAHDEKSDEWKNDKLWLPSLTETGGGGSKSGIWNISVAQRANHHTYDTSFDATIGTSENKHGATTVRTDSWLRTDGVCGLFPSGSSYTENLYDGYSLAVRPALHLNLTDVAKAIKTFDDFISENSYPGIKGSSGSYYITDFTGLEAMSDFTNASGEFKTTDLFMLAANIDCLDKSFVPIKTFTATFDGRGFCIIGLNVERAKSCFIENMIDGTLKNFNFLNCTFNQTSLDTGGASIIYQTYGTVFLTNVHSESDSLSIVANGVKVSQICMGGLVAFSESGKLTIDSCSVVGQVVLKNALAYNVFLGGFIGELIMTADVTITNSYFRGKITKNDNILGRFVGSDGGLLDYIHGSYMVYAEGRKFFYSGFTDDLWVCDLNNSGPVLKWNLIVAGVAPNSTQSVESKLFKLGFSRSN